MVYPFELDNGKWRVLALDGHKYDFDTASLAWRFIDKHDPQTQADEARQARITTAFREKMK